MKTIELVCAEVDICLHLIENRAAINKNFIDLLTKCCSSLFSIILPFLLNY